MTIVGAIAGIFSSILITRNEKQMASFQKGQINNPHGRPVIPEELKTKLKEGFTEAVQFWFDTLRDPEAKWDYRNKSAENIANYGYGKPREAIDLEVSGKVDMMTIEIVRRINDSPSDIA